MIQVNELVMRIPGISEEEGSSIGKEVAQRIADAMPHPVPDMKLDELNISLPAHKVVEKELIALTISEQIISSIRKNAFLTR